MKKQYQRNHQLWHSDAETLPVFGTIASQFNDPGMNTLYKSIMDEVEEKTKSGLSSTFEISKEMSEKIFVIPPKRTRYLSEIAENNRGYDEKANSQVDVAQRLYGIYKTILSVANVTSSAVETSHLNKNGIDQDGIYEVAEDSQNDFLKLLFAEFDKTKMDLDPYNWEMILAWNDKVTKYREPVYSFKVRDKEIKIDTHTESLSHTQIPKVALPKYKAWGDILLWLLQENVPGEFPYTAGLYPFKRTGEDPTRMFAGEGGPERTNRRFHYVSAGLPAKRLSTAFDSVTLYGNDPDHRPDIYGKIGNSGVSICCLG